MVRRLSLPVLVLWALVGSSSSAGASGVYPRLEASFTVASLGTDPFDYVATDLRVQLLQPDGSSLSLPAFFDGATTWRVRHTPSQRGLYRVTGVTLNGQALSVTNLQPASWSVVGLATSPGFVRVDPANTNRFVTSDGQRYFPLGQDVAWDTSGTITVVGLLAKLGAARENWSRIWMDHWDGKNLDWPKVGNTFGALNLNVAQKWDAIVSAAEQGGISFQMTLQHHGQYSSTVDPNWGQNPYNAANGGFLSDATQFFTNATAKALTKRKLRYAVARWGYSPAIMAWELFNEVQFTDAAQKGQWANVAAWHDEMAQFIRSQDAYHHLITTSSQLDQRIWNQCDYYQHHDYPTDLISALRDAPGIPTGKPVKPIFGGECGMDPTPYLGFHAPLWAGLMSAQSGAAQQWYWDHIDADHAYNLFRSAGDFVLNAGLADQDSLSKSTPHVTCPINGSLSFGPGGGWASAVQTTFTVGDNAPDGIGTLPSYLQGNYHRAQMNMPNGYTFLVNYNQSGTFSVQVVQIASSGASLAVMVDNATTNRIDWPASGTDISTNYTLTVNVAAGSHTIRLTNPGQDWVNLGNITLNPYAPILAAYQIGTTNFAALWLWHRTNIYYTNATSTVAGSVLLSGFAPGTYSATWWDTFAGAPLTNLTFAVNGTNAVTLAVPAVLRSIALYAGPPPQAGVSPSSFTQTLATNSPPLELSLAVTNGGGLPLAYSLSITGATPLVYAAIDSTRPGGPVFAWKDISAVGTEITTSFTALTGKPPADEGIVGPIPIGFAFPFFSGAQTPDLFTNLYLSPNGFITFGPFGGDTSLNLPLPSNSAPSNCIAFFWDDLDLSTGGHIYYATDPIAGTFTIQFQNVPIKGAGTTVSAQLILNISGEIIMQYQTLGRSNSCTVGLQNAMRTQGLQVAYNQSYPQNGLAVRVSPTPWLRLGAHSGFVSRFRTEQIPVLLDPTSVGIGNYHAKFLVRTADQASSLTIIPIDLNVATPIDFWRWSNFGTTVNAGSAADNADPDGDGIANLVEYALGLKPDSANSDPLDCEITADRLTIRYQRPHPAPVDVNYIAEVTANPAAATWDSGPLYTMQAIIDNGDGTETVTVTDLSDLGSASAHYLRIRVSR
ncbi:MAG TPA: DUF5060 domain-containing protein [Candidatus Limnocylindrales bacterium]|nr:DUF5060 domain-containing protein [Candidatus Limnocylindrales bacterium]